MFRWLKRLFRRTKEPTIGEVLKGVDLADRGAIKKRLGEWANNNALFSETYPDIGSYHCGMHEEQPLDRPHGWLADEIRKKREKK